MLYILLWIQVAGQVVWADEPCCWSSADTQCGGRSGNAEDLPPPQDVHVADSILSWSPAPDHRNVTYTVQYHSFNSKLWLDVSHCVRTRQTSCDVTDTKAQAKHGCVELRVGAEQRGQTSVPIEACSKAGDSCSPRFSLVARPDSLTVNLSGNHSLAERYGDHAAHRVCFGEEGEPLRQEFGDVHSSVAIKHVEERMRYCVKVQFTNYLKRVGPPSCAQCELIPISEATIHAKYVAIMVVFPFVGVAILLVAYIAIFKTETIKGFLRPKPEMPTCLSESLPEGHRLIARSSPVEFCDWLTVRTSEPDATDEASLSASPPSHTGLHL